jgi:1-deoxy-D-xylulose-5-phosphate reductoisomerase
MIMKKIVVLGSTGSIGQSTLDVVRKNPDRFNVVGLAEGHDALQLAHQVREFKPSLVSVRDEAAAKALKELMGADCPEVTYGIEGACKVAEMKEADTVVSAIVGAAGIKPTLAAIDAGKVIALANKETLVAAGDLVMVRAKEKGVTILPVDSEHSAIFQSLIGHRREDIVKLMLTASGGPFREMPTQELEKVTVEQALNHPRWSMGAKITVDSATLMNKGLEVIEATWLFDMPPSQVDVVIHPQSIVHSMVYYRDGCVMAELGDPDMRAPIAYALSYPERVESGVGELDLAKAGTLTFEKPDRDKFPALNLAYDAMNAGRSMPAVMNAANEVAVQSFLEGRIGFGDIVRSVTRVMEAHEPRKFSTVDELMEIDRWAREKAGEDIKSR